MNEDPANDAPLKSANPEDASQFPPNFLADDSAAPDAPSCEFALEMRFAVVMYGGVSLAIYINGVAQELLHLVRATASSDPVKPAKARYGDDQLSGSARVYREVARLIQHPAVPEDDGNEQLRIRFVVDIISGTSAGGINGVFLAKALANDQDMNALKGLWIQEGDISRLINDGASLESLVGLRRQRPPRSLLNSGRMYCKLLEVLRQMESLAASSPTRTPLVDELDLFLTTTDIRGLDIPIQLTDKPVDEMRYRNVFRLRSSTVPSSPRANDFVARNDPFLAFMARCTSSFPLAFEPMSLDQVLDAAVDFPEYEFTEASFDGWKRFYPDYEADAEFRRRQFGDGGYLDNKPFTYATEKLMKRWAQLPVERKLLYVEPNPELRARGQGSGLSAEGKRGINVFENVKAALLDLPTRETIREDLERLNERNRLLDRVRLLIARVDEDVLARARHAQEQASPLAGKAAPSTFDPATERRAPPIIQHDTELAATNWAESQDLADMIALYGVAYGSYHRLKVHEVTAHFAVILTRLAGFDAASDEYVAVRLLLDAWRDSHYVEYRSTKTQQTQNQFLLDFDLLYRLRRLHFLNRKINELAVRDQHADDLLDVIAQDSPGTPGLRRGDFRDLPRWREQLVGHEDEITRALWEALPGTLQAALSDRAQQLSSKEIEDLLEAINGTFLRDPARRLPGAAEDSQSQPRANRNALQAAFLHQLGTSHFWPTTKAERRDFSTALSAAKQSVSNALRGLSILEDDWGEVPVMIDNRPLSLSKALLELRDASGERCDRAELRRLLSLKGKARAEHIGTLVTKNETTISAIMQGIGVVLGAKLKAASAAVATTLNFAPDLPSAPKAVRLALRFFYQNFENYDQVLFPVLFGTEAGETGPVQVYRISPLDSGKRSVKGIEKLRGRFLASFGAFLAKEWRQNDLLWGRLDGAERLITILLGADHPRADQLINKAHTAIVGEELREAESKTWMQAYHDAWKHVSSELKAEGKNADLEPMHAAALKLLAESTSTTPNEKRLEVILRTFLTDDALLKYFDQHHRVTRELEPGSTARALGRATAVVGELLADLASSYDQNPAPGQWIARLGKIFWGFVEMAVPQSLLGLLFRHWLSVLYLIELLMIGGGMIFRGAEAAQSLGWNLLALTAAIHVLAGLTGFWVRQMHHALKVLAGLLAVAVIGLALLGGQTLWHLAASQPKVPAVAFGVAAAFLLVWVISLEIQWLREGLSSFRLWLTRLLVLHKRRETARRATETSGPPRPK
jgi:patatin-related protein